MEGNKENKSNLSELHATPEQINELLNLIQINSVTISGMGVNDYEFPILQNIQGILTSGKTISISDFNKFKEQVNGVLNKQRE